MMMIHSMRSDAIPTCLSKKILSIDDRIGYTIHAVLNLLLRSLSYGESVLQRNIKLQSVKL
jgi:hypothetical protein